MSNLHFPGLHCQERNKPRYSIYSWDISISSHISLSMYVSEIYHVHSCTVYYYISSRFQCIFHTFSFEPRLCPVSLQCQGSLSGLSSPPLKNFNPNVDISWHLSTKTQLGTATVWINCFSNRTRPPWHKHTQIRENFVENRHISSTTSQNYEMLCLENWKWFHSCKHWSWSMLKHRPCWVLSVLFP